MSGFDADMQRTMKNSLNVARNSLNIEGFSELAEKSVFRQWIYKLRAKTKGQNVTQGWLKCMEMLLFVEVDAYLKSMKNPNVFCNAELPGSFLMAINHYFVMNKMKYNWMLSSYFPKEALKNDGRVDLLGDSYDLKSRNPKNVIFGEIDVGYLNDSSGSRSSTTSEVKPMKVWNDGDLTRKEMPHVLSNLVVNSMGKIDLYTSDGGKDVKGRENRIEEVNLTLVDGEFRTAYYTMKEGAVCIIKIFTIFTPYMQSLIITFKRMFKNPQLIKPFTSNPTNSEIYFIGLGFIPTNVVFPKEVIPSRWWVEFTLEELNWIDNHIFTESNKQIGAIKSLLESGVSGITTSYPSKAILDIDEKNYLSASDMKKKEKKKEEKKEDRKGKAKATN